MQCFVSAVWSVIDELQYVRFPLIISFVQWLQREWREEAPGAQRVGYKVQAVGNAAYQGGNCYANHDTECGAVHCLCRAWQQQQAQQGWSRSLALQALGAESWAVQS